jgi:hypothetical protein
MTYVAPSELCHTHVKIVVLWLKGQIDNILEWNFGISLKEILPMDAFSRQKCGRVANGSN